MTDMLGQYVSGRQRVHGRPGRLALDIPTAASQLSETMGLSAGQRWARDLLAELRAADTPTEVVVTLAGVPQLVEELAHIPTGSDRWADVEARILSAVVDAVKALTGNSE